MLRLHPRPLLPALLLSAGALAACDDDGPSLVGPNNGVSATVSEVIVQPRVDTIFVRDSLLPTDTVRLVTNDFMFTGGDGYTALSGGTDVLQPGDALLDVAIAWVTAHSPVAPEVEGRIERV